MYVCMYWECIYCMYISYILKYATSITYYLCAVRCALCKSQETLKTKKIMFIKVNGRY